jgi:hypothetical protein
VIRFGKAALLLVLMSIARSAYPQTVQERVKALESEMQRLQQELEALKRDARAQTPAEANTPPPEPPTTVTNREFAEQVLIPELGGDEREHQFTGRPGIFLQNRFSRGLVPGADPLTISDIDLCRGTAFKAEERIT